LTFNCNASLVFGPGAAGGFGTIVDFEKIYDVIKLVCEALADIDYRYLFNLTKDAFDYIAIGLYQVVTSPGQIIGKAFDIGFNEMAGWWRTRSALKQEAKELAENILIDQGVVIKGQQLALVELPPETIGTMLFVLSESYIDSWEEVQEKAIVSLLTSIGSWHHFVKILERLSPKAEKVEAMRSLNRLNSILDGPQQDEFNRFIHHLSENPSGNVGSGVVAWTTTNPNHKKEILLAAKASGLFNGIT
jgi:hypothetical protein